tara:strand:+ start:529 stop:1179 length:651 start_codon:yes stop_codon:yes gene_type:complete
MESYQIFDLSILVFILLSAFFAFLRGFSQELFSLLSWIGSFIGSYLFGSLLISSVNKIFNNILISSIVSYLTLFIILLFLLSFITKKFSNTVKQSDVGMIDRTLGFLFGVLRGYVIVSFCLFSLNYFYDSKKIKWIQDSKINFVVLVSNNKFIDFLNLNTNYSAKIKKEIEKKSNKLFEKSIDSHLKLKNHSDIEKKLYDKNERKNLDYLIENTAE